MKPNHVILAIVALVVVFGGSIAIRNKIRYEADGKAIEALITQYKALGIPTNGDEIAPQIDPNLDAWPDLGPLLLNKDGKGNGPLYRSGIAVDLIRAGNKGDLDVIDKYLAIQQTKRNEITNALVSQPGFVVPHDYNQGYDVLLPEYAVLKSLSKDYALEAYACGLRGDQTGMVRNFDNAQRLATHCVGRQEMIGSLVGLAIKRTMLLTAFRLVEVDPKLLPTLKAYFTKPGFLTHSNIKRIMYGQFVAQLSSCRYLDSPLIDRKRYPFPLNQIFKFPSSTEIEKAAKPRHGDYVPSSSTMRSFMRLRLESWLPYMKELSTYRDGQPLPSESHFERCYDFSTGAPPTLEFLSNLVGSSSAFDEAFSLDQKYLEAYQVIWSALEMKAKTGKYPLTLSETHVPLSPVTVDESLKYSLKPNGLTVESSTIDSLTGMPSIRISFPAWLINDPSVVGVQNNSRKTLEQFRDGKVNQNGRAGGTPKASLRIGSPSPFVPAKP